MHLTALMTPNLHQIEVIGRYGQAHDPLLTTRLKSRSLRSSPFLPILRVFCNLTLWNFYRCFAIYYPAPRHCCFCRFCMFRRYFRIQHLFGALLSCPSAADPISLDMLVLVQMKFKLVETLIRSNINSFQVFLVICGF